VDGIRYAFVVVAILCITGSSAQAATITGKSSRTILGELGTSVDITFTSDDQSYRLTKAVIDRSAIGGVFIQGVVFGAVKIRPDGSQSWWPSSTMFSGYGTDELIINFGLNDFEPGDRLNFNLNEYSIDSSSWNGVTIEATFKGSECIFSGTYDTINGWKVITANFGGTCGTAKKGDINGDGQRTAADALLYLRYAVGQDISPYHIYASDDVTCDGFIHADDALKMLRKAVGQDVDLDC
jgi:hypothetical protein